MKLDCVLTAVNENTLYLDFIPFFVDTWNKLYPDVDVKVVLIMSEIPSNLEKYKNNIILFKPIPSINTSFISQYIRMLYPCILNYKNGVMIMACHCKKKSVLDFLVSSVNIFHF